MSDQGVGAHKDSGLLSLLLQYDQGGLQVETARGWSDVAPRTGAHVRGPELAAQVRGPERDPTNPLFRDVARRHYADLIGN